MAKRRLQPPSTARILSLLTLLSLLSASAGASSAGAVKLEMNPGPISNGIHGGNASVNVRVIGSDLVAGYVDLAIDAAFIDTSQVHSMTLQFDAPVVESVRPRLLGSPAGGDIAWSNPSATPIADPILDLSCSQDGGDNECRYRVRLRLAAAPFTGEIAGVPVLYDLAPAVPALPLFGRLALGALLVAVGLRARG
jgi:hypothetical protein